MTAAEAVKPLHYELGRHETFTLRENWLSKGTARLLKNGTFTSKTEDADDLGIGSRMVKSLYFWIDACGLIDTSGQRRGKTVVPSKLAATFATLDPHFEFPMSWWLIHVTLARREGSVWHWFFNEYRERFFDRNACVEAFKDHIRERADNRSTLPVIQREIACLLACYSGLSAGERPDPEDLTICPLRSLALVLKHSDTGRYERARPLDRIPIEAFLAAATLQAQDADTDSLSMADLLRRPKSPGVIFNLDGDMVDEMAALASTAYRSLGVRLTTLGTTRMMTLPALRPDEWMIYHFLRQGAQQ